MSHINSNYGSDQTFDVKAFDANGAEVMTVCSGESMSAAMSCARGFNAGNARCVAVVLPACDEHESTLPELSIDDLCQCRADETENTCTLWDAIVEYCDEDAYGIELEAHRLIRIALAALGEHLPPAGAYDDDALILCERLSVESQLAIWDELRLMF